MGHFGYKLPEGIVGEIGSTANNTIRSGIATSDIAFGDFLELTYRGIVDYNTADGIGVTEYFDGLNLGLPILGVAVYQPSSSNGRTTQFKYVTSSVVPVMTQGDVRLKVDNNQLCLMGDPCYAANIGGKYVATPVRLGAKFLIGTFAETKESLPTNSVLVALDISTDVLVFAP